MPAGFTYKPSIFIASSGKSKRLAQMVKKKLIPAADVYIWTDDLFKLNESTLGTLLNRSMYYDFFIAIFSADDALTIGDQVKMFPRDNVIFEFGLFLGRIGINRTFFLLEDGVELFTDWKGITTKSFVRGDDLAANLSACCTSIKEQMKTAEKLLHHTILPSTALAIGYYHNFLGPVLDALEKETHIEVIEKDKNGKEIKKFKQEIKNHCPTIEIRTPRNLVSLSRKALHARTKRYKQLIVKTKARNFPFYVQGKFGKNSRLHLFDIPTTLLASYFTIKEFFSPAFLATGETLQELMDREIQNFDKTLSRLIQEKGDRKCYSLKIV